MPSLYDLWEEILENFEQFMREEFLPKCKNEKFVESYRSSMEMFVASPFIRKVAIQILKYKNNSNQLDEYLNDYMEKLDHRDEESQQKIKAYFEKFIELDNAAA